MTPRPFAADDPWRKNRTATQGTHVHISINPTVHEEKFMAGILNNYPLLCAFGMASIDSYIRSDDAIEQAAGHWVGWGYQNRYVPVSKVDTGHWEIRQADATANMYMVIATTLAAGLHGIKLDQVLTWKDCQMIPSTMTEQDLAEHCKTTRVPKSVQESLGILEKHKAVLAPYVAPAALQAYENVKRKELDVLGKWTLAERRKFYISVF
jgi:glutamine synthetase